MSFLTDINCTTVLEAIKKEKIRQKAELDNQTNDYVDINPNEGAFWTDLFANCFLCYENNKNSLTNDDMLFFVSKIVPEENKIEVYRRDSKKLPCLTDFNYDWEETVYLNLILHEFEYTLTCAICTQNNDKDLDISKRHSKRVYASPSKRDLKSKGDEEVITYPNLYFTVDDFDEAFNEMVVNEGEMVCVELVANDGKLRKVLFLGSIKYEALKKVYDARASTGAKFVQKMSLGSIVEKRVEFVKMKGPGGKGYAEMAVSRFQQKSDDISTPNPSVPSSPSVDMSYKSVQSLFKFTGFRRDSYNNNSSIFSPSVENRNLKASNENSSSIASIWSKTFGQALSIIKPINNSNIMEDNNEDDPNKKSNSSMASVGIPLNAYLTYVSLKLNLIMQDILDTRQKSVLTV